MTRRGFMAGTAAASILSGCAGEAGYRSTAEATYPPEGDFVEIDGRRVHYVSDGPIGGPTIVLVHGASGNLRDWTFSMTKRLKGRGRIVAFDRPGHGYSDRNVNNGSDPMIQAAHLSAAARQIGVERAIVVGHSWGGAVATAWGLHAPEQMAGGAVLAGATYPWGGDGGLLYTLGSGPLSGVVNTIARGYVNADRAKSIVAGVFEPNPAPAGYAEHIGVELAVRPGTFRWNAEDIDDLNGHLERQAPRYGELAMPLEILHGDADDTVYANIHSVPLSQEARDARLSILRGVGHMPHHIEEDATVAAVDRLLAKAFG